MALRIAVLLLFSTLTLGQEVPSSPRYGAPVRHAPIKTNGIQTPSAPGATLNWNAPLTGCSVSCTYNIYRGATSGSEVVLTTGVAALTYLDTNVVRGNSYCWKVSAVNAAGEGPLSNEACAQIPVSPSAPTGLAVTVQ